MGPGVTGQLIDWADKPGLKRQCLSCHAPLDEQQAVNEDGSANPSHQDGLAASAVGCASCHIRQHTRSGPPKDVAPNPAGPHGGYEAKAEFKSAQMCESCHDFKDGQKSLEGKLLQETWDEWRRTRFAAEGVTCQSCHMPEGQHTFKGVHDPEMVRSAFLATTKLVNPGEGLLEPLLVELTITNVGAGHRFPTYTTPQVTLIIEQVNAAGEVIEGTRQEGAVTPWGSTPGWRSGPMRRTGGSTRSSCASPRITPWERRSCVRRSRPASTAASSLGSSRSPWKVHEGRP